MSEAAEKVTNVAGDALGGVADAAAGAVNTIGDAAGGVVNMAKDVASSDLGKAAILGGAAYMGADAAGLLGDSAVAETGAVATGVKAGSVVETPLGTLDAAEAAGGGAVASAVNSGTVTETPLEPLNDTATAVASGSAAAAAGAGGGAVSTLLGSLTPAEALAGGILLDHGVGGIPKVIDTLTGGGGGGGDSSSSTSTKTTDKAVDYTAGERRASQQEIDDALNFQLAASKRLRGANVLANGSTASIGTKKLLGA